VSEGGRGGNRGALRHLNHHSISISNIGSSSSSSLNGVSESVAVPTRACAGALLQKASSADSVGGTSVLPTAVGTHSAFGSRSCELSTGGSASRARRVLTWQKRSSAHSEPSAIPSAIPSSGPTTALDGTVDGNDGDDARLGRVVESVVEGAVIELGGTPGPATVLRAASVSPIHLGCSLAGAPARLSSRSICISTLRKPLGPEPGSLCFCRSAAKSRAAKSAHQALLQVLWHLQGIVSPEC